MNYNTTPLKENEITEVSFENDQYYTIEYLAAIFTENDPVWERTAHFNENLLALQCGLITLAKDADKFQNPDNQLAEDIEQVMSIFRLFDGTVWNGAAPSRFAPVLFDCQGLDELSIDIALRQCLDAVEEGWTVTKCDFRPIFLNRRYIIDNNDFELIPFVSNKEEMLKRSEQTNLDNWDYTPCYPRLIGNILVDDKAWKIETAKANGLFRKLKFTAKVSLGIENNENISYNTPVFQVGFTNNGRIAGLLCNHVD